MELIPEKTCCFTGHRNIPEEERAGLRLRLQEEIARLAGKGVTTFLAGGALGFDTLAAQEVLRMKGEFPALRLVLILPCPEQADRWSRWDAAVYQSMLGSADEVIYTAEQYSRGCMFTRNRYLADHSAYCICYYNGQKGGTGYTVRYAGKQHCSVINLAVDEKQQKLPV